MRRGSPDSDAVSAEFNRQPQNPNKDPGSHERQEADREEEDAASAEFSMQPEETDSDSAGQHEVEMQDYTRQHSQDKEASKPGQSALDIAHHWAWITIFSILGTLTRLGLQSLNDYTGHLIPPLVWAQFVGCAVMGFVTEDDKIFPKKQEKYDAFYTGITVGYCGSVTSFSAWILQVWEDMANTDGYSRPRGYNVISIITQVMVTLAAAIGGFRLGNHLAIFTDHLLPLRPIPKVKKTGVIMFLMLVAICFQTATIISAGVKRDWRGIVAFAMVFSPAGALTRWYLSRNLNGIKPAFPLGTFAANMVGSLLESIFHLLQYRVSNGNSCSILQGLQDGYCGALTTVSTFVVELCTLQRIHAYRYAVTSIVVGCVIYVLVDGVDYWTHGSASGYYPLCSFQSP